MAVVVNVVVGAAVVAVPHESPVHPGGFSDLQIDHEVKVDQGQQRKKTGDPKLEVGDENGVSETRLNECLKTISMHIIFLITHHIFVKLPIRTQDDFLLVTNHF